MPTSNIPRISRPSSSSSPAAPSRPASGASPGAREDLQRPPTETPAIHAAGRRPSAALQRSAGSSRLEQLPQEMLLKVLNHVQQTDPKSVCSAALASKTMHVRVQASGKLKAESLTHRAKNAWRNPATASAVLMHVIAAIKDETIPLTSEQRADIIIDLCLSGNSCLEFFTTNSVKALIELVEELKPDKQQARAFAWAIAVIRPEFDADNLENFDRLANIVASLRDDEDKSIVMQLLYRISNIPGPARLTRFDRLASLLETIGNEQKKAGTMLDIAFAIRELPWPAMDDRFTRYVEVAHSIQDDRAKATAADALTWCISGFPQNDRRNAFDRLVSIAHSINEAAAKRKIVWALQDIRFELPENERAAALASLPT